MAVYTNFENFLSIPVTKPTTGKWRSLRISPQEYICHRHELDTSVSKSCKSSFNQTYPISRQIKWCVWRKPEFGFIKLNTDGSLSDGYSTTGGLFRDHNGIPLCAYFTKTCENNPFTVELSAIWRGLLLVLDLGIRTIWIESDSLSAVKTVNGERPGGPSSDCYLSQIRRLLVNFDNYRVTHTWREANQAADYVSRMDIGLTNVIFWPTDFPTVLHDIIRDDAESTIYFRH